MAEGEGGEMPVGRKCLNARALGQISSLSRRAVLLCGSHLASL